jgi:hypothetical protein
MAIDGLGAVPGPYGAMTPGGARARAAPADAARLTPEQQQQVQRMRQTDQKVRAHEQAHLAAAAGLAMGGANLQTVRGPDGKQYAVAGEVSIDVSPGNTPQETLDKARRIQAAALAPADPSAQDRAVAAAAAQMMLEARAELSRQQQETAAGAGSGGADAGAGERPRADPLAAYRELAPAPEALFSLYA